VSCLYLYGLVSAEPSPEIPLGEGVSREPLAVMRVGRLLAAVGSVEERPAITAANLAGHDETVRRLALLVPALLPARFGECLPDAAALAEALAPRAGEIARALILVEGCVQMTLRVFGEPAVPAIEIAPPGEKDSAGPGTRYLAARRRAANPGLPEVAALRASLRPLLRAERIERHAGSSPGQLLATAHDLVLRENAGDYARTVESAAAALAGSADRTVKLSGPWPPYAFAPGAFAPGAFAPGGAFRGMT
jgi:hypothetical protein